MPRVEKTEPVQTQLSQIKREMVGIARRRSRPSMRVIVSFVAAALLLLGIGWCVWMVAATGFVSVPVIGRVAYTKPEPTRAVFPEQLVSAHIASLLEPLLTQRLQEGAGELLDRTISLSLSEGNLTATLREALPSSGYDFIDIEKSQVVVEQGEVELFFPIKHSSQETAIRLVIAVAVKEGMFTAEIRRGQVGSLTLSAPFARAFFDPPLANAIAAFNADVRRTVTPESLSLENGVARVGGQISVQIREVQIDS